MMPTNNANPTSPTLVVQYATAADPLPTIAELTTWAAAALAPELYAHELTIRLIDEEESAMLNAQYRGREGATNVLSFPFEALPGLPEDCQILGDLAICAPLVAAEAAEQGKSCTAHWAHLVIHGVLHLQGYDHLQPADAERMEHLETDLLHDLGFPPPYEHSASPVQ